MAYVTIGLQIPHLKEKPGLFYSFMKWMGVQQIPQHADFRLLSDRAKGAAEL
jgi:fatty-acid desaturase